MAEKQGNGGHGLEKYDENTGRYVGDSAGLTHDYEITFKDGTKKVLFNSNDFDPLEVKPGDKPDTVFDKLVAMPLAIKNLDKLMSNLLTEGEEIVAEGFGDLKRKHEESKGIDYRVVIRDSEGKLRGLTIDFKFIKTDRHNVGDFNDTYLPLHVMRDAGPGQFANDNHTNNSYIFMALDSSNDFNELLNAARNGEDLSYKIDGMKMMYFDTAELEQTLFSVFNSGRDGMRKVASEYRQAFLDRRIDKKEMKGFNTALRWYNTSKGLLGLSCVKYSNGMTATTYHMSPKMYKGMGKSSVVNVPGYQMKF